MIPKLRFILILASLPLLGCNESAPKHVPASGKVLIDGEPLAFGIIRFIPEHGRPASSVLLEDGTFDLAVTTMATENPPNGIVPGKYQVQISAAEVIDDDTIRWHAPKKYASFRTSGLEETIKGPDYDLTINLTWDGVEGPVTETQAKPDFSDTDSEVVEEDGEVKEETDAEQANE